MLTIALLAPVSLIFNCLVGDGVALIKEHATLAHFARDARLYHIRHSSLLFMALLVSFAS